MKKRRRDTSLTEGSTNGEYAQPTVPWSTHSAAARAAMEPIKISASHVRDCFMPTTTPVERAVPARDSNDPTIMPHPPSELQPANLLYHAPA
ncbi:hypothetical protein [Prosthecobacter sp.]|uniref:hypothetical protein n=1 Tax=Prosthecobacter sp. TaxID=1965333 RepID=UPI003783B974